MQGHELAIGRVLMPTAIAVLMLMIYQTEEVVQARKVQAQPPMTAAAPSMKSIL